LRKGRLPTLNNFLPGCLLPTARGLLCSAPSWLDTAPVNGCRRHVRTPCGWCRCASAMKRKIVRAIPSLGSISANSKQITIRNLGLDLTQTWTSYGRAPGWRASTRETRSWSAASGVLLSEIINALGAAKFAAPSIVPPGAMACNGVALGPVPLPRAAENARQPGIGQVCRKFTHAAWTKARMPLGKSATVNTASAGNRF
jgi:hypothetical protein